ncbi:hypothetical protein C5167_013454 [Papaver somniferum]|uniref:F-box associated beta-propeller type 3 domain-containing protein n=1 Tax=Papaver somniferum TaxID=3469 RepID=A0A4Y7J3F4_PAPSO|nr:hypothetical protein C5167_013454 [Papaver somniferum]
MMIEKWRHLPEEIMTEILTWLPVKSILRFRSDHELLCIWNPISEEYKKLPQIPKLFPQVPELEPSNSVPAFGFGCDCKTGVYKVVQIQTAGCDMFSQARVYTLGTDSWRVLDDIPYIFCLYGRANGVLLNGVLHWLVYPDYKDINKLTRVILSFDVGGEKFGEIQLPKPLWGVPEGGEDYYKTRISLLDDKLCLSWNLGDGDVDVWVMNDYGVIESWTKLFSVSRLKEGVEYLWPVQSLKNGEILLFGLPLIPLTQYDGDLILYSPISQRARFVDTSGYQILEAVQTYVGMSACSNV